MHGLSCRFSAAHHFCHAMLNYILHRALSSANVPSWLEPTGLDGADGKHPDGITMVPWWNGRFFVWDATGVDTFATSHLSMTAEVYAAENQVEQTKIKKYSYLTSHARHISSLTPVLTPLSVYKQLKNIVDTSPSRKDSVWARKSEIVGERLFLWNPKAWKKRSQARDICSSRTANTTAWKTCYQISRPLTAKQCNRNIPSCSKD